MEAIQIAMHGIVEIMVYAAIGYIAIAAAANWAVLRTSR